MKLMKFKKTVAKSLVFAMALSFAPAVSFTAKADVPTAPTFTPGDCTFKATNAKYWGIAKEIKGKNPEKKGNIKLGDKWYLVKDVNEFKDGIDLSAFSKKGVVVAAGTTEAVTNGSWCIKEIKKGAQDFAVQYLGTASTSAIKKIPVKDAIGDDEYGYIGAVRTKGASVGAVKLKESENVEVKLPGGNWQTVKDFGKKMPMLVQCGSTLFFRIKGTADTFPSKEVKVKVKAQAKAPNVKYNAKKNELGLKKGALVATGASADAATKFVEVKGKATLAELGVDGKSDATVKVKIAAKKNTIASKVQTISLKKQDAPTLIGVKAATGAVIANKLLASLKTSYDLTKGVILENKDEANAYDVFVGKAAPTAKSKWLNVKAAKKDKAGKVKTGKVTIKCDKKATKDSIKDNTIASGVAVRIYVRIPGSVDKQTGEIKMASAQVDKEFKPTSVKQEITCADVCEIAVASKSAVTTKLNLNITNVIKNGKKPKIKVTSKVKGVAVKADGNIANGKVVLVVTSKNSEKGDFKFTVSYEGATKDFTVKVK